MAIRALRQALERFITGTKSTPAPAPAPAPAPKNVNTRSDLFTGKEADQLSQENRGAVVIPDGKEKVCARAFDGNKNVTSISVPGSVKTIGSRAFADCTNLRKVELAEGVEEIEGNVFTNCASLTELTIPDSVRDLYGWAFYHFTGLRTPVYNRSGTILYCYPCTSQDKVFTIPGRVERINPAAFLENHYLEEVIFPPGMKTLGYRSFLDCDIRKLTIPESVTKIESDAIRDCKSLEKIIVLGEDTIIEEGAFNGCPLEMEIITPKPPRYDERLRWFGVGFLYRACKTLPGGHHCSDEQFKRCANGCAEGDARSMWELGDYFASLEGHDFYTYAANFWRTRAARNGFAPAEEWLEQWIGEHPKQRMPSALPEHIIGSVQGILLYYLGFLSFEVDRSYSFRPIDENGIIVADSWCGYDGPDEDGFGGEDCYDWWFLDENLKQIPGTTMVHDLSYRDRSYSSRYKNQYDNAVSSLSRMMEQDHCITCQAGDET